ncbi:MAG: deoxyribose-phosphate aldolase [Anaerolineales bacterium]|jgi:deoxyribose-phosphate aldolase
MSPSDQSEGSMDETSAKYTRMTARAVGQVGAETPVITPNEAVVQDMPTGDEIAVYIDHTLLKPEATPEQVERLCQEALEYGFASVCINSAYIERASRRLAGSNVKVCSVVGFPLGATAPEVEVHEAERVIQDGAQEIEIVMPIGFLKAKDYRAVAEDLVAVIRTAHQQEALVKVIIETALLTREEKVMACSLVREAGGDLVMTSTGFSHAGAKAEDVILMRTIVGDEIGVKAAGGIRSYQDAFKMLSAGASRLGTSSGVMIMEDTRSSMSKPESNKAESGT